ncbi:YdeI/OmpD-associated family protein [Acholeplasma equirhinis]|uniref:YdeI/OmpD-associated family protein n=1 Tax=Acholeplasma equirhinis TaxID=555393 RepID=UPI00197B01BB|nr:YdeI/OmpD-associated family protein [Acholeplasma equirhinis]MBN3491081.1 YdeI/OmpD-associated family protein [Acholeplasma equirhinis]
MKTEAVTNHISQYKEWKEEITFLREIATSLEVDEAIKWGQPVYMVKSKNVFILSIFKNYFTVNFFNGILLKDEKKILTSHGDFQQSSRIIRMQSLEEAKRLEQIIKAYMIEAIENELKGLKPAKEQIEKAMPEYPSELIDVFQELPRFKEAFEKLTPGRKKAYLLYYNDAKQRETRIKRIYKYVDQILDGKGMTE